MLSTWVHVLDMQRASVHRTSAFSLICLGYKIPVSNAVMMEKKKRRTNRWHEARRAQHLWATQERQSSAILFVLFGMTVPADLMAAAWVRNTAKLDNDALRIQNWLSTRLLPFPYYSCTKHSFARGRKARVYQKKFSKFLDIWSDFIIFVLCIWPRTVC